MEFVMDFVLEFVLEVALKFVLEFVLEFVLLFVLGFALEFVIEIPGRVLLCAFFYKDSTTIGTQRGVRLFLKYSQTFFF